MPRNWGLLCDGDGNGESRGRRPELLSGARWQAASTAKRKSAHDVHEGSRRKSQESGRAVDEIVAATVQLKGDLAFIAWVSAAREGLPRRQWPQLHQRPTGDMTATTTPQRKRTSPFRTTGKVGYLLVPGFVLTTTGRNGEQLQLYPYRSSENSFRAKSTLTYSQTEPILCGFAM